MPSDERGLERRVAPLEMDPEEFRAAGRALVDRAADLLGSFRERKLTSGEPAAALREILGNGALPSGGTPAGEILDEAVRLLFEHSLFNGHPRFFGYITASAAPIGALADLLASTVNPNCGAWELSPMANAIEEQTVRWIAELVGFPSDCGGLLVSGGNVANFVCFLAARRARAGALVRTAGLGSGEGPLTLYASSETHTWIHKAADLFGQGTDAIRWVPADREQRMDIAALRKMIVADRARGARPFMEWARTTGDVDLLVVTFEDLAAEAGLVLALASLGLTKITGNTAFDAAGSIAVGVVLLAVALFVGAQIRRLIVGYSVDVDMRAEIRAIWHEHGFEVFRLIAVWIGPHKVMLAIKVALPESERDALRLVERLNRAEAAVRAALPEIVFSFVEPDTAD